jgi:hypothetical protein
MYQLTKIVNDEIVFQSRESENIKEIEHCLKVLASREDHIGITDKSGQLVDIVGKRVIWTPGDWGVVYRDKSGQTVNIKINIVKP